MDLEPEVTPLEVEPPVVSFATPEEVAPAELPEELATISVEPVLESSMVEFWRPITRRDIPSEDQVPNAEDWTELDLPSFEPQMEALESRIRRAVRSAANQAVEQALSRLLYGY
ncbi:MAG: hypothetical protein ACK4P3_04325 [Fimbriimonadaceae bacterium]